MGTAFKALKGKVNCCPSKAGWRLLYVVFRAVVPNTVTSDLPQENAHAFFPAKCGGTPFLLEPSVEDTGHADSGVKTGGLPLLLWWCGQSTQAAGQ